MKARLHAPLSKESQIAVNDEIQRQLIYHAEKRATCYDALILLTLHLEYGFGKKRLREFYDNYSRVYDKLKEYYEFASFSEKNGQLETEFYALAELRNIGVDIEAWRDLKDNWKPEEDEIWQSH